MKSIAKFIGKEKGKARQGSIEFGVTKNKFVVITRRNKNITGKYVIPKAKIQDKPSFATEVVNVTLPQKGKKSILKQILSEINIPKGKKIEIFPDNTIRVVPVKRIRGTSKWKYLEKIYEEFRERKFSINNLVNTFHKRMKHKTVRRRLNTLADNGWLVKGKHTVQPNSNRFGASKHQNNQTINIYSLSSKAKKFREKHDSFTDHKWADKWKEISD